MVDVLIVGAGTAGCVLAARLSEDPARRVALIEAGPDFPSAGALPYSLRYGDGTGFDAGLSATTCDGRAAPLVRGRVVGGSAQVNGCGAVRALPADFDAWAGHGFPEWRWERVLDSYRRLETDHDFPDAAHHGGHGPVPIVRPCEADLSKPMRGFLDAVLDAGHPYRADMNAPGAEGIGPYPQNRLRGVRMSTALTHLAPARDRPNLTVRGDLGADRVVVRDGRAVGVVAGGETIEASEVVLCAGVPMTPALLLRSGIGPAPRLRGLGIAPVADLPGVGRDVYDQPGAVVPATPAPGMEATDEAVLTQLIARLAAIPGYPADHGFYLNLFTGADPYEGKPTSTIMIGDLNPASRGTIDLTSADPADPPAVDLGFYTAEGDLARMRAAYRHAWALAAHPSYARTISGTPLDDALIGDDDRLDGLLKAMTFSRLTLLGGAAMGPVVDEHCRVHGVAGLRAVDLSVVPVPLRAPTAVDAMMLGEHAAEWI